MFHFAKNIKWDVDEILKGFHFQASVKGEFRPVDIFAGKNMETGWAFFHEDDDVHRFYIVVGEMFSLFLSNKVILAHQEIGSVTEASFNWEIVTNTLHFYIDKALIGKLYQDIHNDDEAKMIVKKIEREYHESKQLSR